ncbi:MAG TPA: NosD domain-containing protein, partial [Gemmatimonadales bacterium]|nr:NosD domain-containing protein [Gemmatimonadales bacterium]
TRSVKVAPGTYRLRSPSDSLPVLTIRGEGIRVDLSGVTLVGTPVTAEPDEATGLAILIDGGRDVTVKGGRIRGYQTGIRAARTTDLTLLDNDLSDNWKPRLFSLIGHESLVDWLSFHHNENGEWRRFGAAIALEGVHRGVVRGNTARRGMNGLMLTRSDSLRIEGNDLSFNSGLGIGLYRSTDNVIVRNRADYNVRGFSRYYRRGQDSADLLLFEQSSRNVVAFNSMTHGGDGLFLWAGQSTMDTGEGGSNDNLFLGNDFSYAPTNAMEATFSRNDFIANRVMGSDHGLWGGYSFSSNIVGNCFAANRIGIAIEHGQDNVVARNSFARDSTAIWLWADPVAPSDWGYPKHRDTRSRDWRLTGNSFRDHRVGLRVRQTNGLAESGAVYLNVDTLAVMRDTAGITLDHRIEESGRPVEPCQVMPTIPDEWVARTPRVSVEAVPSTEAALLPRSAIVVDEWGPWDWTTPRLWPTDSLRDGPRTFQVLGPSGTWRVASMRGIAALSRRTGGSGDTLVVTPATAHAGDWALTLTGARGRTFGYTHFEPIPGWDVRYLAWADSIGWGAAPFLTRREPRLDKMWYRPPADLPAARWALEATSTVALPPGAYTLRTISDDAIQVWVDGRLVIDHADPHESLVDNAPIGPGRHSLKVRYRQVDGWMELRVEIVKGHITSTGSPGPH